MQVKVLMCYPEWLTTRSYLCTVLFTHVAAATRYTSPDGVPVDITFVADHGGFQPTGAVLPVAPQLPYYRVQTFNH